MNHEKHAAYREAKDPKRKASLLNALVKENLPLALRILSQILHRLNRDKAVGHIQVVPGDGQRATLLRGKWADRPLSQINRTDANDPDLQQAALIGLSTAIQRFDPAKGLQYGKGAFASYVKLWIRHEVQQCMLQMATIYRPRAVSERAAKLEAKADQVRSRQHREPTAEDLGLAEDEYHSYLTSARTVESRAGDGWQAFDDELGFAPCNPVPDSADDTPSAEERLVDGETSEEIEAALSGLSEFEQVVIRSTVIEDIRPAALARKLGCSVATVNDVRERGLEKLREVLG